MTIDLNKLIKTIRSKLKLNIQVDQSAYLSDYEKWMTNYEFMDKQRRDVLEEIKRLEYTPVISIVMPVNNIRKEWVEKSVQSIINQAYQKWEIYIISNISNMKGMEENLRQLTVKDSRIKIILPEKDICISRITNEALNMVTGEFVAFVDYGDELQTNALFEVVNLLKSCRQADIIYTDSDMIDKGGKRFNPEFKPDWSPELLLSYMYINHLLVCRTTLIRELGGLRTGYDGALYHDLVLRLSEKTNNIYHIPEILYNVRDLPQAFSDTGDAIPYSSVAGTRAVQDAVVRRGLNATVELTDFAVKERHAIYRLNFRGPFNDKVAIIIPTRDRLNLLTNCIKSIEERTSYRNYEIIIADDNSREEATLNYFKSTHHTVINTGGEGHFNFSRIINHAVMKLDKGIEYILFLNNDTEVIAGNWMEEMVGFMQSPEIGAVGGKLLYKDNTIQHAGVILSLNDGIAGHAFKGLNNSSRGYLSYDQVVRNYSAVTGACMLTRRSYFNEVGGFDEENLNEAYNDIDYCLKLREKEYRIVYTPYAVLHHYEGGSRGWSVPDNNAHYFRKKWSHIRHDPYYNQNLEGWSFRIKCKKKEIQPG